MRRAAVIAVLVGALVAPASSAATKLLTWPTVSRFVDPSGQTFNSVPPEAPYPPSSLPVNVLLPDGYAAGRCYPVLYLLHGHGDSYWSWVSPKQGDLLNVARGFRGVVVMPEAAQGWYTNWWNGGLRGSPAWERYYLDELIPLVESHLHICPGRASHAIAGLSMGGEGAIFLASQRPDYFGSAASFSGVLSLQRAEWPNAFDTQGQSHQQVYGDPAAQDFYWAGHNPTALAENLRYTRVFVTVGDGVADIPGAPNGFGTVAEAELHSQADDFVAAAQHAGVDVTYHPRHGIHDWPYWRRALADALGTWGFFAGVPERPAKWSYETVAQQGDAWGFHYSFAQPPGTVETFKLDGTTLHGAGAGAVTIRTPAGARFTATLPFDRAVPKPAATRRKRAHRHRRHHARRHHRRQRAS